MSKDKPRNVAASVRHRLTDMARKQGEDFQHVLTRYVIERLLYRLSKSQYCDDFVLKGAMLFRLWTDQVHRPTRDLDLLGQGNPSLAVVADVFRDVCGLDVEDDGLHFDPVSLTAGRIKEDQEYDGVRIECQAFLGQARIDVQIDVGFGDAVVPRAVTVSYPTMLEFPAPVLKAYPMQTVVAEKYQAMVALGIANSRMKDFFDLWVLARHFAFDGASLSRAIQATFRRRRTAVPDQPPLAITPEFGADAAKVKQWSAFIRKGKLDIGEASLAQVCTFLGGFLLPPTQALAAGETFHGKWTPSGPWDDSQLVE